MDYPRVQIQLFTSIDLLQPEEVIRKTVKIRFDFKVDEYLRDSTGLQTLTGTYQSSPPRLIEFNLSSTDDLGQIYETLRRHGLGHQESETFALNIVHVVDTENGLGIHSFDINFIVTLTHQRVFYGFDLSDLLGEDDVVGRLVRQGEINEEISKSLDLESQSCSICCENLLGTLDKAPTRMSCSHVFHDRCISQWLRQKNSCPLCRRVLYGQ